MKNKINILLVEDNPDHQELMKKALKESEESYEVDVVSSGKECLEKISGKDYSCILLDYKLSKMSGLEIVERFNEKGIDVPVIMITGLGDEKTAVRAMKEGVYEYITKSGDYLAELPRIVKNACEHKLRKAKEREAKKLKKSIDILLVEDEPVLQELTKQFFELSVNGYQVEAVSSGNECLKKLSSQHYDIVLLDYMMPGMDGLEVLKNIRKKEIDIPVIMVTAAGAEKVAMESLNLGADGYVAKSGNYLTALPSRIDTLVEKYSLKRKLEKNREELKNAYEYVNNIIRSIIDILIVADSEGRIKTVNQSALDLLGYREEEIIGQPVDMLFEEKFFFQNKSYKDSLNENSMRNIDMTCKTKSGEKIPVSFSGSVMYETKDEGGETREERRIVQANEVSDRPSSFVHRKIVGIVGIARDMREIRELEAQLVQSSKMAAIGQFATGIAHEIRNPLTAITMNTAFLLEECQDSEKMVKKLKTIEKEADRSSNIVKSLLAFSRPSKDVMVPTDINHLIEETLGLREHQISLANVEIIRNFDTNLPQINVNPGEISQVFLNLINNAVDEMSQGGKLSIKTYIKKETERKRRKTDILKFGENILYIDFEDTGKGIPQEALGRLFTPFYTTKDPGKGVGLGLFVSHGIMERHTGEIEVKSEVGKGSTFIVKLPIGK